MRRWTRGLGLWVNASLRAVFVFLDSWADYTSFFLCASKARLNQASLVAVLILVLPFAS